MIMGEKDNTVAVKVRVIKLTESRLTRETRFEAKLWGVI